MKRREFLMPRLRVNEADRIAEIAAEEARRAYREVIQATRPAALSEWGAEIPWTIRKVKAEKAAWHRFETTVVNAGWQVRWEVVPRGCGWQETILGKVPDVRRPQGRT
jgi:hypothetical protein